MFLRLSCCVSWRTWDYFSIIWLLLLLIIIVNIIIWKKVFILLGIDIVSFPIVGGELFSEFLFFSIKFRLLWPPPPILRLTLTKVTGTLDWSRTVIFGSPRSHNGIVSNRPPCTDNISNITLQFSCPACTMAEEEWHDP